MTGRWIAVWSPGGSVPSRAGIQEGIDAHIRLVAGRRPTGTSAMIPDPTQGANKEDRLLLLEAMMPAETANKLGLQIGGRLILATEESDPRAAW